MRKKLYITSLLVFSNTLLLISSVLILAFVLTLALVSNRANANAMGTGFGVTTDTASVAIYADDEATNDYDVIVTPSVNGNVSSVVSNIRVVSEGSYGYVLAIQSTNTSMVGQTTGSNVLTPMTNSTISSPTAFTSSNCNSWGFATPAVAGGQSQFFDTTYSIESSKDVGSSTGKYAAVPAAATIIHESTSKDETRPYYFAACVNSLTPADTYKTTVVWTAYATNSPDDYTSMVFVDLDPGMIPVRWNYDSSGWVKADIGIHSTNTNDDWYNYTTDNTATRDAYNQPYYTNRKMANAVTFTDATKLATYQSAPIGTPIPEADIAGYWTYVPRFSYKVENFNYNPTNYPHAFDLRLTNKNSVSAATQLANIDTSLDPTTNPQYLTPPAFTFDGQELNGLWFGKYETTGTTTNPTIKPLSAPLIQQTVSTYFQTGLLFGSDGLVGTTASFPGGNTHNFTNTSNVKSHMTKNSEWGVLVYYTQSMYGVCSNMNCTSNDTVAGGMAVTVDTERVRNNSYMPLYYGYATGCSPNDLMASSDNNTDTCFTQFSVLASTTHNVYGIYDTAGGVREYTTGVYATGNGSAANAYTPNAGNSGFTNLTGMLRTDVTVFLPYFDVYLNYRYGGGSITGGEYGSGFDRASDGIYVQNNSYWGVYRFRLGLGHGIFEAVGWHGDAVGSVNSNAAWFWRGGDAIDAASAGVEYISAYTGSPYNGDTVAGFRTVLVLMP